MSSSSFSPDILLSPFVSLDQLILSLVYSSDVVGVSQDFSFFLVPEHALLYPFSVLGGLYGYLLQRPQISRIVYIRQDVIDMPLIPADTAVDYILGKSIVYDQAYYSNFDFLNATMQSDFYTDSVFWSTHMLYARGLDNVAVCPLVVPKDITKNKKDYSGLISYVKTVYNDPTTVCVFFDANSFTINDLSQVVVDKGSLHGVGLVFYDYCLESQKLPHLVQSESIESPQDEHSGQSSHRGLFAV